MSKIVCRLTCIPLRKEPDHRAEQVSQILYGETATMTEQTEKWLRIVMDFDGYTGWIENHSVYEYLPSGENEKKHIINEPYTELLSTHLRIILSAGSEIPFPDDYGRILIEQRDFYLSKSGESSILPITELALKFINVPYQWGGRTVFGMDCSGFIQILFKINGIPLPRDAKDQAVYGNEVPSYEEIQSGDLAFFTNEKGVISHTGLCLEKNKIIHASKHVRVDRLDEKGIFNEELKAYTHQLGCIRRVIAGY